MENNFFTPPGGARELKLRPFDSERKTTSDCSNRFFRKKSPLKVTILHSVLRLAIRTAHRSTLSDETKKSGKKSSGRTHRFQL